MKKRMRSVGVVLILLVVPIFFSVFAVKGAEQDCCRKFLSALCLWQQATSQEAGGEVATDRRAQAVQQLSSSLSVQSSDTLLLARTHLWGATGIPASSEFVRLRAKARFFGKKVLTFKDEQFLAERVETECDNKQTPLMLELVSSSHDQKVIADLCARESDINAQDAHGWTALTHLFNQLSSIDVKPSIVDTLLEYGADPLVCGECMGVSQMPLTDAARQLNYTLEHCRERHNQQYVQNYETILKHLKIFSADSLLPSKNLYKKALRGREKDFHRIVKKLLCATPQEVEQTLSEEEREIVESIRQKRRERIHSLSTALRAYVVTGKKELLIGSSDRLVVLARAREKYSSSTTIARFDSAIPRLIEPARAVAKKLKHDDVTVVLAGL